MCAAKQQHTLVLLLLPCPPSQPDNGGCTSGSHLNSVIEGRQGHSCMNKNPQLKQHQPVYSCQQPAVTAGRHCREAETAVVCCVSLTIPYDIMSLIFAGLRLQHTTTRLSCILSCGTNLTSPLITCRKQGRATAASRSKPAWVRQQEQKHNSGHALVGQPEQLGSWVQQCNGCAHHIHWVTLE